MGADTIKKVRSRHSVIPRKRKLGDLPHDISRAVFFSIIFIAAIVGVVATSYLNNPRRVIKDSVLKTFNQPFVASLEGSTSLNNTIRHSYRVRQTYVPEKGTTESWRNFSGQVPRFDAVSGLKALLQTHNAVEHDREDMYEQPARHFTGSLNFENQSDSLACVFDYWLDMRTNHAVRLTLIIVERYRAVSNKGDPLSQETIINIGYHYGK